jgi:hypothetical protein
MPHLVENIPPVECYVRKEYLTNHESGHGSYEHCYWVSAKSIPSRALYIESYLTQYGALYDKLPISAYVWKKDIKEFLSLSDLQMWDCLSYGIVSIEKTFMRDRRCRVLLPFSKAWMSGQYIFTLDPYGSGTLAETPNEHKSYNFIRLDNGQFGCYPNNRIIWEDASFTPLKPLFPDFKTSTRYYHAEGKDSYASDDTYFYGMNQPTEE